MQNSSFESPVASNASDHGYEDFLAGVRARFASSVASSRHLFRTDAAGLWDAYLEAAPESLRQERRCFACRAFVERYGGLVTVASDGSLHSAIWPRDAPPAYADAAKAVLARIESSNVTGVFLSGETTWGRPVTGAWTHLGLEPPASILCKRVLVTPGQAMAAKSQENATLLRSFDEFPISAVRQALALLRSGSLYRSEKCEGIAAWLLELHELRESVKNARARAHLTWLAVAGAPPGYCHVRSGMIGTLLEDIVAELPFETLKARFDAKMDPLLYMRPQAAPTAGNIAQAEKIVAALKSAGALERRFARLADVQALWRPLSATTAPARQEGVFSHLNARANKPLTSAAPATVMTWVKFASTVLPTAEAIEFSVPTGKQPYVAMVTASHPDAPPILQWDREDRRNPVSHYLYVGGSMPEQWNLRGGENRRVTAVVLQPSMWDPERRYDHQGGSVCFVLEGAKDTTYRGGGGLFPENLKSEYHGVRATLEAHFRESSIEGSEEAEVCGIYLGKGASWEFEFRVLSKGIVTSYRLDRWD